MTTLVRYKIFNKDTGDIYSNVGWLPIEQTGKIHSFTLEEVEAIVPHLESMGYRLELDKVMNLSSLVSDRELPNGTKKSKWTIRISLFVVSLIICLIYIQISGGFDSFTEQLTK